MRIAISIWNARIAPVFDVSRQLMLADVENGILVARRVEHFAGDQPVHKTTKLSELNVQVLICGAISQPLAEVLSIYGVVIIPFIAGDVEEVLMAYLGGKLPHPSFAMPGCCRRRRGNTNISNRGKSGGQMPGRRCRVGKTYGFGTQDRKIRTNNGC
ncbi:MAG: NifB/NifX family molybdenum-iron cluster-binding protein [Desulfobacterales bacterium]|nr:NifB/NifX family molybdenum-iron cluster-binding protein [Desulfobacterales bacterium]